MLFKSHKLRQIGLLSTVCFVISFILIVPLQFYILPDFWRFTNSLVVGILQPFFEEKVVLASDSKALYLVVLLIALVSIALGVLGAFNYRVGGQYSKIRHWLVVISAYYLSLQLFKYGFDKLFLNQFYFPEANTLYTRLGFIEKDLLFWSTMGASKSYSIFSGVIEIIPAILLLYRRTRLIGALISFSVLTNVVAINFGFDITVKLFSIFLLFLSFLIIFPDIRRLYNFFLRNKLVSEPRWIPEFKNTKRLLLYASLKSFVIVLIVFEGVSPHIPIITNQPMLGKIAGGYEVETCTQCDQVFEQRPERFFIHSRGIVLFKNAPGKFERAKLYGSQQGYWSFSMYGKIINVQMRENLSVVRLSMENSEFNLSAKRIDLTQLPISKDDFNWTLEDASED